MRTNIATCKRALCASLMVLASTGVVAQEVLKIGAPTSISGRYVAFGSQAKNGIDFAVETWKSVRGETVAGRKFEVILRDTQSNNATTVTVMTELMQADKVHIVIGPDGSNVAAAAVPPWKKTDNRPIWIMPGGSSTKIEEEIGADPFFFHTYAWAYYYHVNNARALKAAVGDARKVGIIYSDGAYGRAHIEHARKYLKEAGFDIITEELVRENASDFNSALLKVRARRPDILYAIVQTNDAIQLTKQAAIAKLGIPYMVGTAQAQLPEWQVATGEAQNCWTGVTTWVAGLPFPADTREPRFFPLAAEWENRWRARYKEEPKFLDVGYYTSTILALLAVEKAGSLDREKLRATLAGMDYNTPMGSSKFEKSETALHQAFGTMVVFQRQKKGSGHESTLIYPPSVANGKLRRCE